MADNTDNTEALQVLRTIKLRDWAIIIGIFGTVLTYYINTAGDSAKRAAQMETITDNLAEIKSLQKEAQAEQRTNHKDLDKRTTDNSVSIKVLEQRLNEYDKRR